MIKVPRLFLKKNNILYDSLNWFRPRKRENNAFMYDECFH